MAVAPKGIDIRAALGGRLVFRVALKDANGAKVLTGATTLALYEVQDDGSLKTYDWNDTTFKTGAVVAEQGTMALQKGNNNTTDLGIYSRVIFVVTGFTVGAIYIASVTNPNARPVSQEREFQFGGSEGDVLPVLRAGVCQAGSTASTIVLDAGAIATNNYYVPCLVQIVAGTGVNQGPRIMRVYTGLTQTGIITPNWLVVPDITSVYELLPMGAASVESWRASVPNVLLTGRVDSEMNAIQGADLTGNNATLRLKQLQVVNNAGNAIVALSSGGSGHGILAQGHLTGHGISLISGLTPGALGLYADSVTIAGAFTSIDAANDIRGVTVSNLSAASLNLIAASVEAAMLNEGDATALLAAIAAKVESFLINEGDSAATMAAIAQAVRVNLANELARILLSLPPAAPASGLGLPTLNSLEDLATSTSLEQTSNILEGISTEHGAGSYVRNTEPTIPPTPAEIDLALSASHGAGSWVDSGLPVIVPAPTVEEIDLQLTTSHGAGSWQDSGAGVAPPTVEEIDNQLSTTHGFGNWESVSTAGASNVSFIFEESSQPVADADVWITSDSAGTLFVAGTLQTNSAGKVTFLLDEGVTYYLWMQKDGINPILGQEFIATPD